MNRLAETHCRQWDGLNVAGDNRPVRALCLCLSADLRPVARDTVSEPPLSAGAELLERNAVLSLRLSLSQLAELFAHCAISALEFSQGAGLVAWALLSRRQRC